MCLQGCISEALRENPLSSFSSFWRPPSFPVSCPQIPLTSASMVLSPSLTLTFPPPSYKESLITLGPFRSYRLISHIPKSLTLSYLQSSFYHVRQHIHQIWKWTDLGTMILPSTSYTRGCLENISEIFQSISPPLWLLPRTSMKIKENAFSLAGFWLIQVLSV